MSGWQTALADQRLLVTGFGLTGGGIYDVADGVVQPIDDLSTVGLDIGGGRLWRLLRAPGEYTGSCEILSYDATGVRSYVRLDGVRDPHDIRIFDNAVHLTSSWFNAVLRLTSDGEPSLVWRGSTVPDAWHPNSLTVVDGQLHVCAFGRFDRHKAWRSDQHRGKGVVVNLATGLDVLANLDAPHDPRFVDGRWYVCESSVGMLTELSAAGERLRQIPIGHYARGLAVVDGWAFVGVSAHRETDERRAEVAVVDLAAGEVVDRLTLPCLEIYEILPTPPDLVTGVWRGFATNPSRVAEQHQRATRGADRQPAPDDRRVALAAPAEAAAIAAAGEAQQPESLDGEVRAQPPTSYVAGTMQVVSAHVTNRCSFPLTTVPPNVIGVAARWYPIGADGQEGDPEVGPLAALPDRIDRGQTGTVEVVLNAPAPGRYRLSLALQQVRLSWFGYRTDTWVEVVEAAPEPEPASELAPAAVSLE